MRKIVFTYGIISGVIVALFMSASMAIMQESTSSGISMLIGYAGMLVALSIIFVAIKNYRDKHNNGIITFGKAFQIGILIALISSTIYVAVWLVEYYCFMPDFMDKYAARAMSEIKTQGYTAVEMTAKIKNLESQKEIYKNPFYVILFTYVEVLPVGIIVSLICALILKRTTAKSK